MDLFTRIQTSLADAYTEGRKVEVILVNPIDWNESIQDLRGVEPVSAEEFSRTEAHGCAILTDPAARRGSIVVGHRVKIKDGAVQ